jgi:hypothetical protein
MDDLFPIPVPPAKLGLDVRDAGIAGGPIDVLLVDTGRGLGGGGIDAFREFEGVPVLGVEAVEVAAESCFVGDFVGDRSILDGLLPAGLGLAAFMLIRFPAPGSGTVLILLPRVGPATLLGLLCLFGIGTPFEGLRTDTGAGACAMIVTAVGLRNIPFPSSQSKDLSPFTLPSFLPSKSSNSTPTHSPGANPVWPT